MEPYDSIPVVAALLGKTTGDMRDDLAEALDAAYEAGWKAHAKEEAERCKGAWPAAKQKYFPRAMSDKLGYLIEEAGEVLAAAGKSLRWGLGSSNPELPAHERETNGAWLLRELEDLERAVKMVHAELGAEGY